MDNEKKEYIEGIYNYCDRWCEKCGFTSNCYLFNMESKIASFEILNKGKRPKAEDIFDFDHEPPEPEEEDEEEFFEDLSENLEEYDKEEAEREEREIENNPLVKLAEEYFMSAADLLKKLEDKFHIYSMKRKNASDPAEEKFIDNIDAFGWYHAFIGAKVTRAVGGRLNASKNDNEDDREFEEYDMNGSAKVAMISVEKSISALNALYNLLPEFSSDIAELLVKTGKLRNGLESEFPGYKNFKRPGFDQSISEG